MQTSGTFYKYDGADFLTLLLGRRPDFFVSGAVLIESSDIEYWDEPSMNSFEWVIPDNMSVTSSNVSTPIGYREYSEFSATIDYREYQLDRINMHVRTEVLRHIPDHVDINLMGMTDESLLKLFRGLTSHQVREKYIRIMRSRLLV